MALSHLRFRSNFYVSFCIKLIGQYSMKEIKLLAKMIIVQFNNSSRTQFFFFLTVFLYFSIATVSICLKVFSLYS